MTCRRRAARSASSAGPSASGTTSVTTCSRTAVPCGAQQRDRLGREPLAVPGVRGAAGHPADLRPAHAEPVVVELGAEVQCGSVVLVEGQVDHGALGPEQAQRQGQGGAAAAALEHDVGAPVAGAPSPAGLECDGDVAMIGVERSQAQAFGDRAPQRGRVEHHHLLGAVVPGEQPRQQPDDAAAA